MLIPVRDPSDSSGSAPAITLHPHQATTRRGASISLLTRAGDGIASVSLDLPIGLAVALAEALPQAINALDSATTTTEEITP